MRCLTRGLWRSKLRHTTFWKWNRNQKVRDFSKNNVEYSENDANEVGKTEMPNANKNVSATHHESKTSSRKPSKSTTPGKRSRKHLKD